MTAGCLCFRSRRASRVITRHYDAALRPFGLHSTQLTLMNLAAHGGAEGMPMSRLADVLALEISSLTRNLRPLVEAGLISVAQDPEDRRVRVVHLTPAGQARLTALLPVWQAAHAELIEMLGAGAVAELNARLDQAASAVVAPDGED